MHYFSIQHLLLSTALALLSGCATAPDVDLGYVMPKASVTVKVDQSITCAESNDSADNFDVYRENTVTFTAAYEDDNSETFYINPKALGTWYADSEFKVTFQGGRLSTIAPSVTGSGPQIVDFVVALGSLLESSGNKSTAADTNEACKLVKSRINGKLKKFNATYSVTVTDVDSDGREFNTRVEHTTLIQKEVAALLAMPTLTVTEKEEPNVLHKYKSTCFSEKDGKTAIDKQCLVDNRQIVARAPAWYEFSVTVDEETTSRVIGIPQKGRTFPLPLPKPALFGKSAADIAFNADGSIKSITYNASGDFEGLSKSVKSIEERTTNESVSELDALNGQLAVEKAKADLIYQQKRKIECENNPELCKIE